MKNNWSSVTAKKYINRYKNIGISKDLALRVYTTRLLGRNNELVLHGGGNTSVKTSINDIETYVPNIFNKKSSVTGYLLPIKE